MTSTNDLLSNTFTMFVSLPCDRNHNRSSLGGAKQSVKPGKWLPDERSRQGCLEKIERTNSMKMFNLSSTCCVLTG